MSDSTERDAIDHLVETLSQDLRWQNGPSPRIPLAESARVENVVTHCLNMMTFDEGTLDRHDILAVRTVRIANASPVQHQAVLVHTNLGPKVVLFRYDGPTKGWWTRVFAAR